MNVLIFAGAGASKAVNDKKYPTTVEFYQQLPSTVRDHPLVKALHDRSRESHVLDIEMLLWDFAVLTEFASRVSSQDNPIGYLLSPPNRLGQILGDPGWHAGNIHQLTDTLRTVIAQLTDSTYRCIYDLYAQLPTASELRTNWLPLVVGLLEGSHQFDIVTTNYDLVLETLEEITSGPGVPEIDKLRQEGRIVGPLFYTGVEGRVRRLLQYDHWKSPKPRHLLTKLHGSVDWSRITDGICVGDPLFKTDHAKHVVLYPGFKGVPTDEPFSEFHRYFEMCVAEADAIICVGFSFRDEHINQIFRRATRRESRIVIMDRAKSVSGPYSGDRVTYIEDGFNRGSVKACLNQLT